MSDETPKPLDADLVKEAGEELLRNGEQYKELVQMIRDKKSMAEILVALPGVSAEVIRDIKATMPVVQGTMHAIKSGTESSEYKNMKALQKVFFWIMILGPVVEGILVIFTSHFYGGSVILSSILAVLQTLQQNNYNAGRVAVKRAALEMPFELEEEEPAEAA